MQLLSSALLGCANKGTSRKEIPIKAYIVSLWRDHNFYGALIKLMQAVIREKTPYLLPLPYGNQFVDPLIKREIFIDCLPLQVALGSILLLLVHILLLVIQVNL
jgi:hypothetical protein